MCVSDAFLTKAESSCLKGWAFLSNWSHYRILPFAGNSLRLQTRCFFFFFRYLTYVVSFSLALSPDKVVFKELCLLIRNHMMVCYRQCLLSGFWLVIHLSQRSRLIWLCVELYLVQYECFLFEGLGRWLNLCILSIRERFRLYEWVIWTFRPECWVCFQ